MQTPLDLAQALAANPAAAATFDQMDAANRYAIVYRLNVVERRQVRVGDRRFGVTGCGGDIFLYAPLVRPSIQLVETCPTTRVPIHIAFTPDRVERVEPSGAVVPMSDARELERAEDMRIEDIDASL
jgi:hypothetical protein